jgi:Fic family protein
MTSKVTHRRTYESTHPWLTFSVNMERAPIDLWMLLGEAKSKIEHLAYSPLKPSVAKEMHSLFLIKGAVATTAIEGNTLTEEDARRLIEGTLKLPPSQQYLAQELKNIFDTFNEISGLILRGEETRLTAARICDYNRKSLHGLELGEDVIPGEIRKHSVVVGRYRAAPAEDCEYLLHRLAEWLESSDFDPPSADWALPWAVLKAVLAHLYLTWIHPFGDGNGRTARLMELQILLRAGVATPAAHLLSNHYNLTRNDYYRQLDHVSHAGQGDPLPFITYAVRGFVDGLRNQLERVSDQQFADRWEQYIYETFGERRSAADQRRLKLVLAISEKGSPSVPISELRHLTPELAEAYAGTVRTVARDVNALQELGLIERSRTSVRPRSWIIRSFLPLSTSGEGEAGFPPRL